MNIKEILKNNYNNLHDFWISELNIIPIDNTNIEATFETYDNKKVKILFKNVNKIKYGLDGDYIIYGIYMDYNNDKYTFATAENYYEHEELDFLYVECKGIEVVS